MALKERGQTIPEGAAKELARLAEEVDLHERTDEACQFLADMWAAGWSCGAMGRAMGWGRSRVWYWANRVPAGSEPYPGMPEIPDPPEVPEHPRRKKGIDIPDEVAKQMRVLHRKAVQLRGGHPEGHPFRVASEALTEQIDDLTTNQGATYKNVADVLGVKVKTVRERLARHGYRSTYPALTAYKGGHKDEEEQT